MREFDVPDLLRNLSRSEMYGHYPMLGFWNDKTKGEFGDMLTQVGKRCEELDLPVTRTLSEQWRRMNLEDYPYLKNVLSKEMSGIRETIVNEMKEHVYLVIPKESQKLYRQQEQFGPKVLRRFRRVVKDLDAACRCLALEEGTASVFHLMRVLEVAVQQFGKKVSLYSVTPLTFDFEKDTWGSILRDLDSVIKGMPETNRKEKHRKEAFHAIYVSLDHLKRAFRNKTAHPRKLAFTIKEAKRIFSAGHGFLEAFVGET